MADRSSISRRKRRVITSCMAATSFWPSTCLITNRRYSLLRGRPSSKTTIEATTSVPCRLEMSKHSIRSGTTSSSRASWISSRARFRVDRSLARVVLCLINVSLAFRPTVSINARLSPRCGTLMRHGRAPAFGEHPAERLRRRREHGNQDLLRQRVPIGRLGVGVELEQELLDQLLAATLVEPVGHPAALTADPAAADVEDLHGHLQRILGECDHVGVGGVAEDDRVLFHGPLQGGDVVPQPGRPLVLHRIAGRLHLALQFLDHRRGLSGDELAEVLDDRPVFLRRSTRPTHGAEHLPM